ncbi:hypothetical protein CYMTET_17532, partial [Cymbomonas tetramitiformis]
EARLSEEARGGGHQLEKHRLYRLQRDPSKDESGEQKAGKTWASGSKMEHGHPEKLMEAAQNKIRQMTRQSAAVVQSSKLADVDNLEVLQGTDKKRAWGTNRAHLKSEVTELAGDDAQEEE